VSTARPNRIALRTHRKRGVEAGGAAEEVAVGGGAKKVRWPVHHATVIPPRLTLTPMTT